MKVRILSPALDEIVDAVLWFDAKQIGLGGEFWQCIDDLHARIGKNPTEFAVSEFATPEMEIRFAVIRRFHYVMHFLVEASEIQILSVAHGARRPGYWLRRIKR